MHNKKTPILNSTLDFYQSMGTTGWNIFISENTLKITQIKHSYQLMIMKHL